MSENFWEWWLKREYDKKVPKWVLYYLLAAYGLL